MSRYLAAALVVLGLLAIVTSEVSASGLPTTKVVYVAPVDQSGHPLSGLRITLHLTGGNCEPGSDSVPGPVYRCFVGNSVLDPCWADSEHARTLLCMTEPWSQTAVELQARRLTASTQPVPRSLRYPWGVKLANGKECIADQGAHDEYRGRVVDYSCGHAFHLVLLRRMNQSHEPWTYDSAIWTGSKYITGPTETVRIAWYGGPQPAADG